jgi:hypothetical protein
MYSNNFSNHYATATDHNNRKRRNFLRNWYNNLTTTGATGGTFSAAPAGLTINGATGVIDLALPLRELIRLLIVLEQLLVTELQQAA